MSEQTHDELDQTVHDVVRAWLDGTTGARYTEEVARAVLTVPEIADALMAAREVRVYRTALGLACSDGWSDGESAMASYIETAETHLAILAPGDDSDIMPGSEFDGPVTR